VAAGVVGAVVVVVVPGGIFTRGEMGLYPDSMLHSFTPFLM